MQYMYVHHVYVCTCVSVSLVHYSMSHTLKYFILLGALIKHPTEPVNDHTELTCSGTVDYMHVCSISYSL